MNAHRAERWTETEALIEAHAKAEFCCDLSTSPAPPPGLVRSQADHGYVFVTDGLSASATVRDESGEIVWFTHLNGDLATNLAALCDAIHEAFGVDPWGMVRNPEMRAAMSQLHLHPDPDDPEKMTWRRSA